MMTSAADDVPQEISRRVFQNEYIVEHLFSFLSVNDIKNCRLANVLWMKVGTRILRSRVQVLFDFRRCYDPNDETLLLEKMKEISHYCKENKQEITPISSFVLQGVMEYLQLINFLDDVRDFMKELKLKLAIFRCPIGEKMTVDIIPKISPYVTKLHLEMHDNSSVLLSLCFDQIVFVKDIYVNGCTIVLNGSGRRLSPSHISLGPDNKYMKNGTEIKFLVNDCFDLTRTKEVYLRHSTSLNLILDFSDCANDQVERNVTLNNITIRNWEMCNWKIKKLSLDGVPFLDKNLIQMEELTVESVEINLSKINNPTSLLKLYCCEFTTIADDPFFLPNLVDVKLIGKNCVAKLPYFRYNKNISTMSLQIQFNQDGDPVTSVNVNDFPKGIKELTLVGIEVHDEGVCRVQTLNLKRFYSISQQARVVAKFRTKNIHMLYTLLASDKYEMQRFMQLLNMGHSSGRLVMGDIFWMDSNQFNNSVLSKYVDRQAVCYAFEGKRGKALTTEESTRVFSDFNFF